MYSYGYLKVFETCQQVLQRKSFLLILDLMSVSSFDIQNSLLKL
jgi:hypothetical protein